MKPRVALISDVRGWAFDQNMQDMASYLGDQFDFDHLYVRDWYGEGGGFGNAPSLRSYDVVYCLYHRWGIDHLLPWPRTVGSLRARWIFPERKRPAEQEEFDLVNQYVAYQVVTMENYSELKPHCPGVVYLTNPVSMRRFPEPTPIKDRVVVSWNGNAGHSNGTGEDVKGFWSIILPACRVSGMPIEYAESSSCRIAPKDMPEFYQNANVTLSASLYEGASNSVMEGMAAGHAVISTDAGNIREIRDAQLARTGETGIMIVERSIAAFVAAFRELKADPGKVVAMGLINRDEIDKSWSWSVWAHRYEKFLRSPLEK